MKLLKGKLETLRVEVYGEEALFQKMMPPWYVRGLNPATASMSGSLMFARCHSSGTFSGLYVCISRIVRHPRLGLWANFI